MNLEYLLGTSGLKSFQEKNYQNDYIYVDRGDRSYYDKLIQIDDIDQYLAKRDIRFPSIRLVKDGVQLDKASYLDNIPYGNASFDDLLNNEKMFTLFQEGVTIVLQTYERHNENLRQLALALQNETLASFQANIYITPSSAQGFAAHYDTHDVFVLQIYGEKEWFLYDSPEYLPTTDQKFFETEHSKIDYNEREPKFNKTLKQGDLLYIPRGMVHQAKTNNKMSMHITIGMFPQKWHSLFNYLGKNITSSTEFRTSIFSPEGIIDKDQIKKEIINKISNFMQSKDADEVIDKYIQFHTAHKVEPSFNNRFLDIELLSDIELSSKVCKRQSNKFTIKQNDEEASISLFSKELAFPLFMLESIEYVKNQHNNIFSIDQIKGNIDDDSKILFTKELIGNGFLTISEV